MNISFLYISVFMHIKLLKIFILCIDIQSFDGHRAEKAMTSHSSTLAWKIPWTEKPGRLKSMGSQRVGHD